MNFHSNSVPTLQIQVKLIDKVRELLHLPMLIKIQRDPVIEVSAWMVVCRLLTVALSHQSNRSSNCKGGRFSLRRTVSVVHSAEHLGGLFSPESHRMPFHIRMSSPVLLYKCDIPILPINHECSDATSQTRVCANPLSRVAKPWGCSFRSN